ncbi:unnamed protein product [Onchocerca flexuosa]|uniref:RCR-type E3 ubiquitin transferase n=1 Tax=Onchocerca flexuosa TaxID=387005 RepID=A0A183H6Z3_9BILA|nr:unnamed protein product [Onchocerca flexuosa]
MVEFNQSIIRENIPTASYNRTSEVPAQANDSYTCRFCTAPLRPDQLIDGLCNHEECRHLATFACQRQLSCSHICGGIRDEEICLPCMNCRKPDTNIKQDADDLCVICFTDRLGGAPCIQLTCEHVFHYRCVQTVLEKRWNGPRIVFRFMQCPLCKKQSGIREVGRTEVFPRGHFRVLDAQGDLIIDVIYYYSIIPYLLSVISFNFQIDHPSVADLLLPLKHLYNEVLSKARLRLEYDGLLQCPAITSESSEYYNNPNEYAMERYMYVLCFKCGKAYFGGESRCQQVSCFIC